MAWVVGGFIGLGLVALFYLRSGAMGCKYTFVPGGEDWRTFYRQSREKNTKSPASGRITWIAIGIGLGVAVVAGIIAAIS